MATADELLATKVAEEEFFLIDLASRTISIPKSVPVLGVESDEDVMRVKFKLPRFYHHSDFAKFIIGVNYVNAKGTKDRYEPDDIVVGSDYITFSWVVGRLAAIASGNVTFNLCLKKMSTTDPSVIDDEFNTTTATLPIIKGLEVSQAIVQAYSDVLEQWRQQLFGFGDTLEQRLNNVAAELQAAIEAKGAETRDTIPDDYNELYDMANAAVRTRANAVIETAEGEVITAHDCSDDPLRGLRAFGKSTQATTTGAQLLNFDPYVPNLTASEAYCHVSVYTNPFPTAGTYYYSCSGTFGSSYKIWAYDSNENLLINNSTGVIEVTEEQASVIAKVSIVIQGVTAGATYTGYIYPMINAGDTALPYEPYSGGVASPCLEWSQEIESINNPTIGIFGSNLADASSIEVGSNLNLTVSEDGYTVEVTGGADKPYTSSPVQLPMEMLRGKKVILSADSVSNSQDSSGKGGNVQLNIRDSVKMKYVAISPNNLTATTIIPEDVSRVDLNVYTNNSATLFDTPNTTTVKGLRLSVVDTAWEAYRDAQMLSIPYPLRGIPVSSGGDYVDQNGQRWICDEIDHSRKAHIQRVKLKTYDGTEDWFIAEQDPANGYVGVLYTAANDMRVGCTAKCSHYLQGNSVGNVGKAGLFDTYYGQFRVNIGGFTSVDEWKAKLIEWAAAGTPLTLLYVLATPIETPLTDAEIYAFSKIHSNYPNVTIMNDSDAHMAVEYNADTKIYCAKTHGPTDDQVQSAVDEYLATHLISAEGVSF